MDAGAGRGVWPTAKNFYARRFLRILPIYYLTLFVVTPLAARRVIDQPGMVGLFKWHVTYTTNVYVALFGYPWKAGAHFWTLAVEEQFYLAWPWVVLLVPRRHLLKTVWGSIGLAVAFRVACAAVGRGAKSGCSPSAASTNSPSARPWPSSVTTRDSPASATASPDGA